MNTPRLHPIGQVRERDGLTTVVLDPAVRQGLDGLQGFSHVVVVWWADEVDTSTDRGQVTVDSPYPGGPDQIGVFATRSPARPNPIGLSVAQVVAVDVAGGTVTFGYLDAHPGTAVLDLKPYTPSMDRVEAPSVPDWCGSWPRSLEESATFDWAGIVPG